MLVRQVVPVSPEPGDLLDSGSGHRGVLSGNCRRCLPGGGGRWPERDEAARKGSCQDGEPGYHESQPGGLADELQLRPPPAAVDGWADKRRRMARRQNGPLVKRSARSEITRNYSPQWEARVACGGAARSRRRSWLGGTALHAGCCQLFTLLFPEPFVCGMPKYRYDLSHSLKRFCHVPKPSRCAAWLSKSH